MTEPDPNTHDVNHQPTGAETVRRVALGQFWTIGRIAAEGRFDMAFRLATVDDRAVLAIGVGIFDLERHSNGRFSADPMNAIERHAELHEVSSALEGKTPDGPFDAAAAGPCIPRPQKVFGIGLNYRSHAAETGMELGDVPLVFSKFRNCLTGPEGDVIVFGETTDWEAELVVVMGRHARDIAAEDAWEAIAGLTCGQDISERRTQFSSKPPHFDMAKSFDTFGPIGPYVVSLDQFDDPSNLALTCDINGERRQDARTDDLIFSIPELISYLSAICTLEPGDLIFTGTPSGVGVATQTFLKPGDTITTTIEGIGSMTNRCVVKPV